MCLHVIFASPAAVLLCWKWASARTRPSSLDTQHRACALKQLPPFFHGPIATCALFMDALRCAWMCTRTQTHMCTLLRAIMLSSLTSNMCFLCLISFQLFRKRSCNCWRQLHVFEGQPGQVRRHVCVTCHALVTRRQRGPVPPRPRSPSFFSQKAGGLAGRHPYSFSGNQRETRAFPVVRLPWLCEHIRYFTFLPTR